MKIYHYHFTTKEFLVETDARPDPLEIGRYLIPANATEIAPPPIEENQKQIFDESLQVWTIVPDFSGKAFYLPDGTKGAPLILGDVPPPEAIEIPPPANMVKPRWHSSEWEDIAITYRGISVETKADVDRITQQAISDLGEQKAKTEKLIAGTGDCLIWDAFIAQRNILKAEGDEFIAINNLQ